VFGAFCVQALLRSNSSLVKALLVVDRSDQNCGLPLRNGARETDRRKQ